jgi:hypothetical protein
MTTVRRTGTVSVANVFGLALTVGLVSLAAPKWTEEVGLDIWDVPALQKEIETEANLGLDLNLEIEESKSRLELKEQLIANLRAGRITLKEVTAAFLTLNESQPVSMFLIRSIYQGATDEEKTARNAIAFAIQRKSDSPARETEVLARLLTEFRELTGNPAAELH